MTVVVTRRNDDLAAAAAALDNGPLWREKTLGAAGMRATIPETYDKFALIEEEGAPVAVYSRPSDADTRSSDV